MPDPDLSQALEAARQANVRGESLVLVQCSIDALRLAEAVDDELAAAEAGLLLARGHFSRGNYAECVRHGRMAQGRWQRGGRAAQACAAMRVVAHGLYEGGVLASALVTAREGFAFADAHGLFDEAVQMLVLVGTLHGELQAFKDGEVLLLQALSRAREMHQPAYQMLALSALVVLMGCALETHRRNGRSDEAAALERPLERHAMGLHRLASQDTHRSRRAFFLGNAGEALGRCGRTDAASAVLAESLALAREEGLAVLEIAALGRLARLQLAQGDFTAAERSAQEMQQALAATPHPRAQEDLLALQSSLCRHEGREAAAIAFETQEVEARQARERQAEALRRELDVATDVTWLLARLHHLETRS